VPHFWTTLYGLAKDFISKSRPRPKTGHPKPETKTRTWEQGQGHKAKNEDTALSPSGTSRRRTSPQERHNTASNLSLVYEGNGFYKRF